MNESGQDAWMSHTTRMNEFCNSDDAMEDG